MPLVFVEKKNKKNKKTKTKTKFLFFLPTNATLLTPLFFFFLLPRAGSECQAAIELDLNHDGTIEEFEKYVQKDRSTSVWNGCRVRGVSSSCRCSSAFWRAPSR